MSSKLDRERLIQQQEARVLACGAGVARAVDVRAIAEAVTEEERHGKAGTVRDWDAVFIWRVTRAVNAARARERSREEQTLAELERYADLWVAVFTEVAQRRSSPVEAAALLRTLRANGFPKLNPRIAEKLAALGPDWPAPVLTPSPSSETTRRARHKSREDAHAGAHATPR